MSHDLHRDLAPITPAAWAQIEEHSRRTLKVYLAARKLVDFTGPVGWETAAVPTGRLAPASSPVEGVRSQQRQVLPLVELSTPFELSRAELDSIDRGNPAPDLEPLLEASRRMAAAEDRLVFRGLERPAVRGIADHAVHPPIPIPSDYEAYPRTVSRAVECLRSAGVAGPYAIALSPRCFSGLTTTVTPAGYPVLEHVDRLVDGPLVWAPAIDGALVISLRGHDFELVVGRDLSIGYASHDRDGVQLYLQESVTFRLKGPDAAVPLVYEG